MIPIPPRRTCGSTAQTFVVVCDECGARYLFRRPRRTFTRFAFPGHGPGEACDGRSIRILHYRDRLKALKAEGKI